MQYWPCLVLSKHVLFLSFLLFIIFSTYLALIYFYIFNMKITKSDLWKAKGMLNLQMQCLSCLSLYVSLSLSLSVSLSFRLITLFVRLSWFMYFLNAILPIQNFNSEGLFLLASDNKWGIFKQPTGFFNFTSLRRWMDAPPRRAQSILARCVHDGEMH